MKADKTTTLGAADAKKPKAKKGAKMTREERTAAHWRKKADDMEAYNRVHYPDLPPGSVPPLPEIPDNPRSRASRIFDDPDGSKRALAAMIMHGDVGPLQQDKNNTDAGAPTTSGTASTSKKRDSEGEAVDKEVAQKRARAE